MAINRYTDLSVSAYNPMSMEELAVAPMMKRKQHDEALAKQELIRSGLAKVDPHSKYFTRAQELKQGLESKMDTAAEELATQGFNNDMIGKSLALNREFQTLTGPTGEIGQINLHNQNFKTASADYLANATKMGYSPETVQSRLLDEQQKHITGEDRDELGNVKMFHPNLPTNYIDHVKTASDLFKDTGLTQNQVDNLGSHIEYDSKGGSYVLTEGYKTGNANNDAQLEAAVRSLNDRINDPNQPVRKSLDYQGISPVQALEDIKLLAPVYSKKATEEGSTKQISNMNTPDGSGSTDTSGTESIVTSTAEIGKTPEEYDQLDSIGAPVYADPVSGSSLTMGTTGNTMRKKTGTITIDDVGDDLMRSRYKATYNEFVQSGKLPKGADMNSDAAKKLIKAELIKEGPITLSTVTIKPNMELSNYLFPNKLVGKDDTATANNVFADIVNNARKVINIETGEEIPVSEFKENKAKVQSYYGYDSPHNWGQNGKDFKFGNPSQNVAPNRIIIEQDGKIITAVMSRPSTEFNTRQFSVMKDLHNTYRQATIKPNKFVKFESSRPVFKNVSVKYITKDNQGYQLPEPIFDVKLPNGTVKSMTENKYLRFMAELGLK
jgi:hypothetical protein